MADMRKTAAGPVRRVCPSDCNSEADGELEIRRRSSELVRIEWDVRTHMCVCQRVVNDVECAHRRRHCNMRGI